MDHFWVDEDKAESESALFELISDFLDSGSPTSKPVVLLCAGGRYNPYNLTDASEPTVVSEHVQEQSHANDRLLSHLLAQRPDTAVLNCSSIRFADIGALVQSANPTHVLCLPPAAWELHRRVNSHYQLAIPTEDRAILNELGVQQCGAAGMHFTMVMLALLTRQLKPAVRLGAIVCPSRIDSPVISVAEDCLLRPLRQTICMHAGLLDVSILDLDRVKRSTLPAHFVEVDSGPTALVSVFIGNGPPLARFRRLAGDSGLQCQLQQIREVRGFALPSLEIAEQSRANDWYRIPEADAQEGWAPERHSEAFQQLRSSFSGHGDWLEFGTLTFDLPNSMDSCYDFELPSDRQSYPVLGEAELDAIQAGAWDGSFSERVSVSPDAESWNASDLIQAGDLVVHAWASVGPPRTWILVAREEHAGSVPSDCVRVFRLGTRWEYARQWILEFLRSEAFEAWQRLAQPTKMFASEHLERLPVPLPSHAKAAAFADSAELEDLMRVAAEDLHAKRASLLRVSAGGPGWRDFGVMASRTRALKRAIRGIGQFEVSLRHGYPRPLALAWRDALFAAELGEQLELWLRLAEACAAYVATVRLSQLDADGRLAGSDAFCRFVRSLRTGGGLTFGAWASVIKAGGHPLEARSPLEMDLASVISDPDFLDVLDRARHLRNAASHHRINRTLIESEVDRAKALATALLKGIEPIASLELVEVEHARNDPKANRCLSYRARVLAGDDPLGELEEGRVEQRLEMGALYLRCLDGTWLMPSPFLVTSPKAARDIYVPDRLGAEERLLFRPLAGSGEVSNPVAAAHYAELERASIPSSGR